MSLDKSIKSGKEHRKPYRKAKAVDPSCRNHGNCTWCQENRQYKNNKRLEMVKDYLKQVQYEQQHGVLSSNHLIFENINRLCDGKDLIKGCDE